MTRGRLGRDRLSRRVFRGVCSRSSWRRKKGRSRGGEAMEYRSNNPNQILRDLKFRIGGQDLQIQTLRRLRLVKGVIQGKEVWGLSRLH